MRRTQRRASEITAAVEAVVQVTGYSCILSRKRWAVRRAGAARAHSLHDDRGEAWILTMSLAQRDGVIAYLHDAKGRVVIRAEPRQDP